MIRHPFWKNLVGSPRDVGAVCPSSRHLGDSMAAAVRWRQDMLVLELGTGTGAITSSLLAQMPGDGQLISVEKDPELVAHSRRRMNGADVRQHDAFSIGTIERGDGRHFDAILSSLPVTNWDADAQRQFMSQVRHNLAPGGQFIFATYVPLGVGRSRFLLQALQVCSFVEIKRFAVIWRNLPPAIVYDCR